MRKTIFVLSASIFIFGGFINALAQCGATGLDPCMTKPAKQPTKTPIKKNVPVKKAVASDVKKSSPKKSVQTKTKSGKTGQNNKSIYDSLTLEPEKSNSSGDVMFPVNGVTIGKTTEAEMRILGGKRNVFNDDSTGTERVYYTLNNTNFWIRDGVADSIGVYKFLDRFPTKWELLGFNFQLSYKESVKLLKSLDYEVQEFPDLPKLEDIGKVNRSPRIVGTKKGKVPTKISMSFIVEKGQSYDSPGTLLYMFIGVEH